MIPCDFEESNGTFGPAPEYNESHMLTIPTFSAPIQRGPFEGAKVIITAWTPSPEEIQQIVNGSPIFLTVIGSLPPHSLHTTFKEASNV